LGSFIGRWFPSVVATFLASSLMIIPSDGSGVRSFERCFVERVVDTG
jgi:hypothetical protein